MKQWELSVTCGMMGVDWDDADLDDFKTEELQSIHDQFHNGIIEIDRELRRRGM